MSKIYDLGDRTRQFAKDCRVLVRTIKRDFINHEDSKQLVRSSGSVAANYIEANESVSEKNFIHKIKICRKESKESGLWLSLLIIEGELTGKRAELEKESQELVKIFSSIAGKNKP